MKIIGVEYRVQFRNYVMGQQGIEVFLHPLDIDCPKELGEVLCNMTIHTSDGDRGNGQTILREQRYGTDHERPEVIAQVSKQWLQKYGCIER